MDEKRKSVLMAGILASQINAKGVLPLNSTELDRKLARLLTNPEFKKLGVTLREMRKLYGELSQIALETEVSLRKKA